MTNTLICDRCSNETDARYMKMPICPNCKPKVEKYRQELGRKTAISKLSRRHCHVVGVIT